MGLVGTMTDWWSSHAGQISYLIPVLAFLEACAGVGLFVSGAFLLTAATALYLADPASLSTILMFSFIGAMVGDHSGYFFGRYFEGSILKLSWLKNREQQCHTVQSRLARSAPLTICVGRFIPILSSLTPLVAGLSGLRFRTFVVCDVLACGLWTCGLYLILINLNRIAS